MCLYKTHEEPRIAQDDIEVWKVLTYEGLSPYQNYPYHPGMNKPTLQSVVPVPVEQSQITVGYLHAYRNKEKAELYATKFNYIFDVIDYAVQRMLIPKGTAYYEGDDDDICSKCLYWPEEETASTL